MLDRVLSLQLTSTTPTYVILDPFHTNEGFQGMRNVKTNVFSTCFPDFQFFIIQNSNFKEKNCPYRLLINQLNIFRRLKKRQIYIIIIVIIYIVIIIPFLFVPYAVYSRLPLKDDLRVQPMIDHSVRPSLLFSRLNMLIDDVNSMETFFSYLKGPSEMNGSICQLRYPSILKSCPNQG